MQKDQIEKMWKSILLTWHLDWTTILKLLSKWEREKYQVRLLKAFSKHPQAIKMEKLESNIQLISLDELFQRCVFLKAQLLTKASEQSKVPLVFNWGHLWSETSGNIHFMFCAKQRFTSSVLPAYNQAPEKAPFIIGS